MMIIVKNVENFLIYMYFLRKWSLNLFHILEWIEGKILIKNLP